MPVTQEDPTLIDEVPGLRHYGNISSRVAVLIKAHPPLSLRFALAPSGAFHSYIVVIQRWDGTGDVESFAKHLYDINPRELVCSSFAAPSPVLFRALKKAGVHAHTPEYYVRLNLLLSDACIAREILQVAEITSEVVNFFYKARLKRLDHLVFAAHESLNHKFKRALALDDVLKVCRRIAILPDDKAAARAIRRSSGAVHELIAKWLEKCKCPFNMERLPAQLTQIKTAKELDAVARRFKNCLINNRFKIDLASGKRIFIVYKEGDGDSSVEAVATLVAEPYQVWWIDECNLICRHAASRAVRERIVQLLGQAGIEVAVRGFQDAWDEFSSSSATPRIEDLWNMTWANQD